MSRELTQQERVAIINAVQALVGRLDRTVGPDALFAAYSLVGERIRAEFRARYVPEPSYGPPPPPPREVRALPPPWTPPRAPPLTFDPFA